MRPGAPTRARQQAALRVHSSFSGGRPVGDGRDPCAGRRHPPPRRVNDAAARPGGPGPDRGPPRSDAPARRTRETVSTACADGAMPAALPGEGSISMPSKDAPSVARRVSNRSPGQPRSLVNRSPSTRRPSFARAVIVQRSSASRPRAARPRRPIGAGMAGWLMTDATTDGSSAVASAKPPVKHIPTTPTPGPPHSR